MNSYPGGIFVDADAVAIEQGGDAHVGVEVLGHDLAIAHVIAQDGVLDVAAVRIDAPAKFERNRLERFVGRREQGERPFSAQFLVQSRLDDVVHEIRSSQFTRGFQDVLQRLH